MANTSRRLIVMLVLILGTASCSRTFVIKPIGRVDRLTFHFYETANDTEPVTLEIVQFLVEEQQVGDKWTTVWEVNGRQFIDAITYGEHYSSLTAKTDATRLKPGTVYRALRKTSLGMTPSAARRSASRSMRTDRSS